jgi:hypothetical protein
MARQFGPAGKVVTRETMSDDLFFPPEKQKSVMPAEFTQMFSMESFHTQSVAA